MKVNPHWKLLYFSFPIIAVVLSYYFSENSTDDESLDGVTIQEFSSVVFPEEWDEDSNALRKWVRPIEVKIDTTVSDLLYKEAVKFSEKVSSLRVQDLNLSVARTNDVFNALIVVGQDFKNALENSKPQLARVLSKLPSFDVYQDSIWQNGDDVRCGNAHMIDRTSKDIVFVFSFIKKGMSENESIKCAWSVLASMIGLRGTALEQPSVRGPNISHLRLTDFDLVVIKQLYSPAILSGLQRDDLVKVWD